MSRFRVNAVLRASFFQFLVFAFCFFESQAVADELQAVEVPATAQLRVNSLIGQEMASAELSMLFQGTTIVEFQAWKERFRAKLNELLGSHEPPENWKARQQSRTELADHTRLELLLESAGVPSVPVYLLIPHEIAGDQRAPAVLCLHGHGPFGNEPIVGRRDLEGIEENIEKHNYDYGLQFVRQGYVVAAPCMIPFGRRVDRDQYKGNDPCAVTFVRMLALGKVPMAHNLRDLRWTLSLLESRPEVDSQRIGCAGLSYGGRMTMLVAAMDDRIRVAAISGALNLQQERFTDRHSCGSQIIPGLLNFGDYSEIGSLIAPRPCVWETGSVDTLIVPIWDELFRDRLRRAYQAAGAADQLYFDRFEGGHQWSGRVALPLFAEHLKP